MASTGWVVRTPPIDSSAVPLQFAAAGHEVSLHDPSAEALASAPQRLAAIFELLGQDPAGAERVSLHEDLAEAVTGAAFVFEAAPERRDGADHAIALARAARARIYYQLNDDAKALDEMIAAFERRPASAGTRDGMGITPGETAQMLLARLRKEDKSGPTARLEAALGKIDPTLLAPDIGLRPEDTK